MALIVETGTASADSESYSSVAQADTYFANRGMTIWAPLQIAEKEQALRRASDYIIQTYRMQFAGRRVNDTQALDFPRYNVPRNDGVASYYASNSIPNELVKANIELAIRAAAGELLEDIDPPVTSEQVGSIKVTYAEGASKTKKFPTIDKMLSVLTGGGANSIRLVKA